MILPSFLISQTYTHMTAWFLLLFLYFFVLIMYKETKGRKITHLIVRLMYIVVIITGGALYYVMMHSDHWLAYMIKVASGIIFIILAEITIVRANKNKKYLLPFLSSLAVIGFMLFMGYYLPMGMDMFH